MNEKIRLLALSGLMGFLGAGLFQLMPTQNSAKAATASWNGRGFYLTKQAYQGNATLKACSSGYHMASIWEIREPSLLKYDTSLGASAPDSGSGPPIANGWVRTGSYASSAANPGDAGTANCNLWTSNSGSNRGTAVTLVGDWSDKRFPAAPNSVTLPLMLPWRATNGPAPPAGFPPICSIQLPVWCVQD